MLDEQAFKADLVVIVILCFAGSLSRGAHPAEHTPTGYAANSPAMQAQTTRLAIPSVGVGLNNGRRKFERAGSILIIYKNIGINNES